MCNVPTSLSFHALGECWLWRWGPPLLPLQQNVHQPGEMWIWFQKCFVFHENVHQLDNFRVKFSQDKPSMLTICQSRICLPVLFFVSVSVLVTHEWISWATVIDYISNGFMIFLCHLLAPGTLNCSIVSSCWPLLWCHADESKGAKCQACQANKPKRDTSGVSCLPIFEVWTNENVHCEFSLACTFFSSNVFPSGSKVPTHKVLTWTIKATQ